MFSSRRNVLYTVNYRFQSSQRVVMTEIRRDDLSALGSENNKIRNPSFCFPQIKWLRNEVEVNRWKEQREIQTKELKRSLPRNLGMHHFSARVNFVAEKPAGLEIVRCRIGYRSDNSGNASRRICFSSNNELNNSITSRRRLRRRSHRVSTFSYHRGRR